MKEIIIKVPKYLITHMKIEIIHNGIHTREEFHP